jgi:glycosyltransferase involved in cell wall biosynthesis
MVKVKNQKVSVIVNCHNGQKYLNQCINSILNQTFKNLELIFFDNCSNDKSLEIIRRYKDKRIKVHSSKKFLKLYHARNEAIKKAKGKYICFLDVDDYWEITKLEKQVNFLEKNLQYSMVYSNFFIYHQNKKKKYTQTDFVCLNGNITNRILKKYNIGAILTACIRRNVFNKIIFNKNFNIIGDFDFFIRLSLISKLSCIKEPLANYRLHNNNYSKKRINEHIEELKFWLKKNKKKFKKLRMSLFYQKVYLTKLQLKYLLKNMGV